MSFTTSTYDHHVNEQMSASEAWKFFTQLTRRAFSPDVLHLLRTYAASNPHLSLPRHLPLLLSIIGDHVRLALEEGARHQQHLHTLTTTFPRTPPYDAHHRRLAFKKRTLSLRPPEPPTIPEHEELSDARRTLSSATFGPARAATTGAVGELYGALEAHGDRHTLCAAAPHREWSKSYRDLDARRRQSPNPPSSPVHAAPPRTTSLENNANLSNIATTIAGDAEDSFVRSKSLWRGRPKRRNSVRGAVALSVAPLAALLDKRKRNSRPKSPHNSTPTTVTSTTNTTM